MEVLAKEHFEPDVIKVTLKKAKPVDYPLQRITRRMTVKHGYLSNEIKAEDIRVLSEHLTARERKIAIQPMTQYLEEESGLKQIAAEHEQRVIPQFVLRIGYMNTYPDPVSLRRPVSWFLRS
jgi:hypothetical protein